MPASRRSVSRFDLSCIVVSAVSAACAGWQLWLAERWSRAVLLSRGLLRTSRRADDEVDNPVVNRFRLLVLAEAARASQGGPDRVRFEQELCYRFYSYFPK